MICGIDPGFDGGMAFIAPSGDLVALELMPVIKAGRKGCRGGRSELDLAEVHRLLTAHGTTLVCLERVSAMRGWGSVSAWRFGVGWGQLIGLVRGLGISLILATPQQWQASILKGTSQNKTQAIAYALRRWPAANLRPGRRTKPHDGLADALCLAEFGRQQLVGGGQPRKRRRA
jgi:crossover junction endodeoxyribonuclease RuvC